MPASIDDVLTAIKNIASALNAQTTNETNLAGAQDFYNITTPTLVKSGAGRVVNVVTIVSGSADGVIYDASNVSDTSRPIYPISHTATSPIVVNMPFQYGLLVSPGTGQTIAGSFS